MRIRWLVAPLVMLAWSPLISWSQEATANLTALRAKTDINDEDRAAIRAFVTQRVGKIVANSDATEARQATEDLRSAFDGTDAFKREYAAIALDAIGSAYKKADLVPATRLLALVNTFNVAEAFPLLVDALQDDRIGIQAAAAIGLRTLRPKLASGGRELMQRALDALKEAGKREKSRDALRSIYAAMNYAELPSPPDPKPGIAAVLDLLEARAREYAAGQISALGADDTGLRVAQALVKSMDEAELQRLTVVTATMMKYAIEQYSSPATRLAAREKHASPAQIEIRNALERLVLVGEELLVALLKPEKAPAVNEAMRKLNTVDMKNEWQTKWVPLLQKAVNQDFTLKELPEAEDGGGDEAGGQ